MKRVMFLTAVLGLFFALNAIAVEPGDTLWARTYGGSQWEEGHSVQQTSDGEYIIAGFTGSFGAGGWDVYLVKTDSCGNTLWTRTYGGVYDDQGRSVQQTTEGGYIIAGFTGSFGAGSRDVYLVKTDSSGDTLWTRTYGGSEHDCGYCVEQTPDGGYIIAGATSSFGAGAGDVYLLKTNSWGDTLWTRTYGGRNDDGGWCLRQTSDGGYVIVGYTRSFGAGGYDVYLVRTDSSGGTLWTRTYGGSRYDWGRSVQQTYDGGYVIGGYSRSFGACGYNVYLLKTDSCGDTLWTRTYGGSDDDGAYSVRQTSDGGYIIAGWTRSFGAGLSDLCLLKTDSCGDTLWTRTYGGSDGDWGESVQQTIDGNYIVAGVTHSFGAGEADMYLVRVAGEELPEVSIELVPDPSPVVVPQGGSFGFTGTVTNNTEVRQGVDIWTMAYVPEIGMYGPLRDYSNVPFNPHQSRSAHLNQNIPNNAPISDEYIYYGYVGDYPVVVIDSSYFPFEVTAKGVGRVGSSDWTLTGSFLEGSELDLPTEFALSSNYPNPFNASTVIEYQLPEAGDVKLEVYNLIGEKVATLVNGAEEAGYKSVTWDASEVSSGLYFYRLTSGDFSETKMMMLVK